MDALPIEIYPLFIQSQAEAEALRRTCTALNTSIPRDLFKCVLFTSTAARWESTRYYTAITVTNTGDTRTISLTNHALNETGTELVETTITTLGNKYILTAFDWFISFDTPAWWCYVEELKPTLFVLHSSHDGGGKIKPAEYLTTLPQSDKRTGATWFADKVKWNSGTISLFVGNFDNLLPLKDSECSTCIYRLV